jgi:hypothetical protein
MMSHRVITRIRFAPILGIVSALAAIGAGPLEPWETVRTALPPVTVAPGVPSLSERLIAPSIPTTSRVRPRRPIVPVSNQVPVPPVVVPARPANATPRPIAAPFIPRVPGKIGSVAAIGRTAASTPYTTALPTRTRVYVINGVDPFGVAGLSEMTDRIRASGYPDTKFGGWYQVLQFDREIRAAHREDPGAQFVIIGYSYGVYRAKALANRLTRDGIPVAMVGYIGGDYLRNEPASQMAGGPRVVNVMGDGYLLTGRNWFFNGTHLNGADNLRMPGVRHFGLPKQEQTVTALLNGMNAANGGAWTAPAMTTSSPIATGRR